MFAMHDETPKKANHIAMSPAKGAPPGGDLENARIIPELDTTLHNPPSEVKRKNVTIPYDMTTHRWLW